MTIGGKFFSKWLLRNRGKGMNAVEFQEGTMKTECNLAVVLFGLNALSLSAATHFVWQTSPGPTPPWLAIKSS